LPSNYLLSQMSDDAYSQVIRHCTHVHLRECTVLYSTEVPPQYAYFLTSGIASIEPFLASGEIMSLQIVGREALIGSLHLLGPTPTPTECIMKTGGPAQRISLAVLQQLFKDSDEIRDCILRYVQQVSVALAQIAVCHRYHEVEQRFALWLLVMSDRMATDQLPITHEDLAGMIGARRPTVTARANELRRKGIIDYERGRLKILDRIRLQSTTCSCYKTFGRLRADSTELQLSRG
jgi:CRP-like cAMP-binding protein